MPIKITVGTSRNTGQSNLGSWGATCSVEFDLDDSGGQDWAGQIRSQAQAAFSACRMVVDAELVAGGACCDSQSGATESEYSAMPTHGSAGNAAESYAVNLTASTDRRPAHRPATANQVRAIYGIANKHSINLDQVLRCYGASNPQQLSISDASMLIDSLKAAKHLGAGAVAPPPMREMASQA